MKFWGPLSALGLGIGVITAAADQLNKLWMIGILQPLPDRKIILAPYFDLVLVWNSGISYGLFKQNSDAGRFALAAFSICAVLALAYWLSQLEGRLPAIGAGLIAGGALGNAADRIFHGAVADFYSFHIGSFQWYVFNLADAAIVAGVCALLLDALVFSHNSARKEV